MQAGQTPVRALWLWFIGLCLWGCTPPPLEIEFLSCAVLHKEETGQSCDLNDDGALKLRVITSPSAEVSLYSASRVLIVSPGQPAQTERLLSVQVPAGVDKLSLRAAESWVRTQVVPLAVRPRSQHEAQWLTDARKLLDDKNDPRGAEEILLRHVEGEGERESRALARFMLADIAMESIRPETHALLDRAIRECEEARLPAAAAQLVLRKSWLLSQHRHRYREAERVLEEKQKLFAQLPEQHIWELSQRALMRRGQGDLPGALPLLSQAEEMARRFNNDSELAEILNQRATTLVMMGRMKEAADLLTGLAQSVSEPCRRGRLLGTQGYTFIRAREALRRDDPLWKRLDPQPVLEEALRVLRGCKLPWAEANVLTNLAHAAAATENQDATRDKLREARASLAQPDRNLALEWAQLDGQLALWRNDSAAAYEHYRHLAQLGAQQDAYESTWLALVGQAQAEEGRDAARARTLYQRAEDYLDQRSLEMPLGAGRGSFLGRFERGTARYLDFLTRSGLFKDAVRVARHARARGLWTLGLLMRADALPADARKHWEASLEDYRNARHQLDVISAATATEAGKQRNELQREQPERVRQLLGLLEKALLGLGDSATKPNFREPAPKEAMLICHPGVAKPWHCFVWTQRDLYHLPLSRMDDAQLGTALVRARSALTESDRLTVIGYGEMRRLDMHLLPWPGATEQVIDDHLSVAYALDVPWLSPSTNQLVKRALLVFDPHGTLPHTRRAAAKVIAGLGRADWQIAGQAIGVRRIGDYAGKPQEKERLDGKRLRELLGQVGLFHFGGHGDFDPVGGWGHRLRLSDGAGLLLGDILMLPQAPQRVLLFGCNTGQSAEETSAIEGLGLAQAFLLRGSAWVIATERKVSDEMAAQITTEIYSDQKTAPAVLQDSLDPAANLRALRRKLAPTTQPAHRLDLAAFRVFVP